MKIRNQLLLTHGLLVLLSLIIVIVNIAAYKGMSNDAFILNKAGKLRALSYNMGQIANRINSRETDSDTAGLRSNLELRLMEFESILRTLNERHGAALAHDQTLVDLDTLTRKWDDSFKPLYMRIIENGADDSVYRQINWSIDHYVNEINDMVTIYSTHAERKVVTALIINAGLIIVIILVTIYSFMTTNRRIQKPINLLMHELKELSYIDDELSQQLKSINANEIGEMTQYFNAMVYDQLTKVYNRRPGLSKLQRILSQDNRRCLDLSICFIDVNGLKEVNDALGHKFGDELIISTVESIKQEIRTEDFTIRMGGDEFMIILSGIGADDSEKVWKRINRRYEDINEKEGRPYLISISHGIVEYDNNQKPGLESFINMADSKMYEEKKFIKEVLKFKAVRNWESA
ncbi:MAG TPA: diguanylate cyclase [Bacillota bacterium]|nr:diguanylate cyclase [Bacillota bacterium]